MAENARRRHHHQASVQLLEHLAAAVAANELLLIFVDDAKQRMALEFYRAFSDLGVSFTDCLSFAIMRELGISTAFTGDWHFTLPGFNIIPGVRP